MPRLLGLLLLLATLTGSMLLAQEQKKEAELTKEERQKLEVKAKRLNMEGFIHYQSAKLPEAEKAWRQALQLREKLYPKSRYPDGHPDLAESLHNMADLLETQGKLDQAEPLYRATLAMRYKMYPSDRYPNGHPHLALNLNNLAYLLGAQGKFSQAEPLIREALAMWQKLYPPARYPKGHPELANSLSNLVNVLKEQEKFSQAEPYARDALAMSQKLYPPARYPNGHHNLFLSINRLAYLFSVQEKFSQAEPLIRDALVMSKKLYPPAQYPDGHSDLVVSLWSMADVLQEQEKFSQAEPYARDALAMSQKLYSSTRDPFDHHTLVGSMGNLARLLEHQGKLSQAVALQRDALTMLRKSYPDGHPDLASNLNNLATLLRKQGQLAQAEAYARDALAMTKKLYPPIHYPNGHSHVAASLDNLALLLQAQGKLGKAEPLMREALAMLQKLYPPTHYPAGHSSVSTSLNNLANVLKDQDKHAQAESLMREALMMDRKLYPPEHYPYGHQKLVADLGNFAFMLWDQGKLSQAEPLLHEAMVMLRKLYPLDRYPDGHPDLAVGLNNLAFLLKSQGKFTQAEPLLSEAKVMLQKLYPAAHYPYGHPHMALLLTNLADLFRAQGKLRQAETLFCEAVAMYHRLALAHAEVREEGEMLNFSAMHTPAQHLYLSLVHQQPTLAPQAYATFWASRNLLTRLAEQKRLAVRATSRSPTFRQQWVELVSLKRQRAQLLLARKSRDPETIKAREKLLEEWGQKINDLSAEVRYGLPALQELQRLDSSTPTDLQKAMPKDAVFIDLLRYTFFEYDPAKPGKPGEKRSLRYVAFIVSAQQIQRVDLGPAELLEAAVKQWRESITTKNAAPDLKSPSALRRLLWEPLEKHFPPGTTTVYLCPDQLLCFLPWGALPGKKAETVLLEEYTLAIVPHGPYLLGQLLGTKEKETKKTDLLVLGGVKYDDAPVQATVAMAERGPDDPKAAPVQAAKGSWPYLKGTATEAETIRKLAQQRQLKTQLLSDRDAGTERFKQELPKARIAHLATHGFFADPKFRSVFQLDEKHFAMRGNERVGAGALLPSLLSGLVFAGANRPETPGRGIVTAEELFDLDLTSMELAVLSACETGLGDVGGGEGVFGLQRAFHVVGCQNVIASLWKVGDVPTLVLMEEFYRNLWEKKLSKREALRQAQLTVYRNPEMVLRRAKEMGVRGIEDEAVPLPAAGPTPTRRSPPAWWAAFLLSGLGE